VSFDVLLQILWSLESLAAEVALVRLERDMDADVRCYVVALHSRSPAVAPLAGKIQIVGALTAHMPFAHMVLDAC
jgi:hypothetical protein